VSRRQGDEETTDLATGHLRELFGHGFKMPVPLEGDPRPHRAKGKFAECVEIVRQQRLQDLAIGIMNQASMVSACRQRRLQWRRGRLLNWSTITDQMRLGISAALSRGRRVRQFDLSTGANRGLRHVPVVGVRGCLGNAHATALSVVETLTSTRHFVLGGRREPFVRIRACLGISHALAQTLLVTRTNARYLGIGHFLFHAELSLSRGVIIQQLRGSQNR
jgi:hypothetical protein